MANPVIQIRRSAVSGRIPSATQLSAGEFAINTYDGKVFIQQDQGAVGVGTTIIVVNPWSVGTGTNTYNTYFTAGSVGIGTTLPKSTLHVVGVVSATSFVGDGSQLTGISVGSASQWITTAAGIHTLSNVGIGTTNPTSRLTLSGNVLVTGISTISTLYVTSGEIDNFYTDIGIATAIRGSNLNYTGVSTLTNATGTNLNFTGVSTLTNARGTNLNFTGVSTLTNATGTNINFSGVGTVTTLNVTNLIPTRINSSGVSTFSNGPVLISNTGTATTTGTLFQPLQVTGGAYVSGSVGFGTTNPREKLDVSGGNISIQGISTSNRFYIQHNTSLNSLDFVFI
jgi:hypothetical protein